MKDENLIIDGYKIGKYKNKSLILNSKSQRMEEDLIDKVLSDKFRSIQEHIRQIEGLIKERKEIKRNVFSGFEREIDKVNDIIFGSSEPLMGYHTVELKSTKDDLESTIIDFEKAMIDEEVAAWRDVLDLKKELIELRKELKSIESKSKLFIQKKNNIPESGSPTNFIGESYL